MMFRSSNSKDLRLYIAFYIRGGGSGLNDVPFHTALVLVSKNPSISTCDTWRYHVKNVPVSNSLVESWRFESIKAPMRTSKLWSLLFLNKVPPTFTPEDIEYIL